MYACSTLEDKIVLVSNLPQNVVEFFEFEITDLPIVPDDGIQYELEVNFEDHTFSLKKFIENAKERIEELKQLLSDTDYQAIKYAEGWISEEDYAPIKEQRQEWRNEINELMENE